MSLQAVLMISVIPIPFSPSFFQSYSYLWQSDACCFSNSQTNELFQKVRHLIWLQSPVFVYDKYLISDLEFSFQCS